MKLSQLLHAREGLQRRASLANLAFAYRILTAFATRVRRARLTGSVNLKSADPDADRYWATLTALDFNQSVIEEHFSEEDLMDLADTIAYLSATDSVDLVRPIEDLAGHFIGPVRGLLERAGVVVDADESSVGADSPTDAL